MVPDGSYLLRHPPMYWFCLEIHPIDELKAHYSCATKGFVQGVTRVVLIESTIVCRDIIFEYILIFCNCLISRAKTVIQRSVWHMPKSKFLVFLINSEMYRYLLYKSQTHYSRSTKWFGKQRAQNFGSRYYV